MTETLPPERAGPPPPGGQRRDLLLLALRDIVGREHVLDDDATLERYARSTAARPVPPLAVVRPGSHAEVVLLVKAAARFGIPLYPVSTGRNWGYGDACAVEHGQLLIELARMNRIVSVDPELAYAVIEPGVTQQQLSDYLREHRLGLWMDCTGAGPDTSLMGNVLERGFGHSPYGNRLQHVSGLRVVLASGEVLHTGFGHYPQARTTHLFPYGVGPFLDGIFTQSNLGIVTELGLWLMPQAQCLNHFLCEVRDHGAIAALVDALRPLRLDGTLRSIVHIGNDLRVISGGQVFPSELAPGHSRLPDSVRADLRARAGGASWVVSGALYGSDAQVAAARAALRRALRHTGVKPRFLNERKLRWGGLLARLLGQSAAGLRLQAKVALGNALFAMNRGIPNGRFLAGAYWRRRGGLPADFPQRANPAADNCGLLWVSPVLPMRGADVMAVHALAEPVFRAHGFDLFVTFSMINERALGGVLTIAFDKDSPEEVARAQSCHQQLFGLLMAEGYIPYRVGNQSMAQLDPDGDEFWKTAARIKQALDPQGLIAPGRYQPRHSGADAQRPPTAT